MLTERMSTPEQQSEATRRCASLIVLDALDEYNRGVEPALRVPLEPTAPLYGPEGGMDSFGLLDFVTLLEAKLTEQLGRPVSMVEESQTTGGPTFRTVQSVIAAVESLLVPRHP